MTLVEDAGPFFGGNDAASEVLIVGLPRAVKLAANHARPSTAAPRARAGNRANLWDVDLACEQFTCS